MKSNIILVGFMGSGKSSVGKRLASMLSYQFHDTDHLIEERMDCSISEIFAQWGEQYFRSLETKLLLELNGQLSHSVLSTGGGLPLKQENAKLLQDLGTVVYLKATKETTWERLKGSTSRPLLAGDNPQKTIEKLIHERTPIYEAVAQHIIETDDKTFEEILQLILDSVQKEEPYETMRNQWAES